MIPITPAFPCLGGFIFSIKNKKGSALVTAILISVAFLTGAAVITTYFNSYLKSARARRIDQENYRIGQELAKLVGEAYERKAQYSALPTCPVGDIPFPAVGTKFCFVAQPQVTSPIFNHYTVQLDLGASQVLTLDTSGKRKIYVFNGMSTPGKTWPWSFLLPEGWAQSQKFIPNFGAVPTNTYTALDCSTSANPMCHTCTGGAELCFQLRYCSIESSSLTGGPVSGPGSPCPNNFISQDIVIRSVPYY